MPLVVDPDVGSYVTRAECQGYKDQVLQAVRSLSLAVNNAAFPVDETFQALLRDFAERVVSWYNASSCWWGSTTDEAIELAREYNEFESRFIQHAEALGHSVDLWSPQTHPSSPSSGPNLVAWVIGIVVVAGGGFFLYHRYFKPRRKRRRKSLGAVRRSGVDGPSLYQLEI